VTSGKTKNGFVWTFGARDDEGELDVAYVFTEDRSGSTPQTLLEGTTGVLLVDGYSGYNVVDKVSTRRRAACHAAPLRHFHESLPTAPVAQEMLDLVAELYLAEHAADEQGLVGVSKLNFRKQRAGPIRARLRIWLDGHRERHPQLSASRLRDGQVEQAAAKHSQLEFTHRALEAEQQSVIRQARVVRGLAVDDARADQAAEHEQVMPVAPIARQT
jgi:hypothetical protein